MDLKRITAGSILVLILLGLCLYYYNYHEDNLKYPSTAAIESYYPEGSLVFVDGSIIKPNNNGFYLRDGSNIDIVYNIISSEHVEPNDNVQVLGILEHNYTINSTRTYVETKWGYEFIILRSGLALIVFIFIFFRYWKFNFRTLELTRLKETRACKSERFAASKSKILTGFLNHKIFKNRRFLRVKKCSSFSKILKKILRRQ